MSKYHAVSSGMVTRQALPSITRQRGTTTGSANLMLYGAGKTYAIGTNTTFTDSSANAFTVTRNGDTIQATANPFTGSVVFDGTSDYLSLANNAAFDFGTGDFTVECWVNINSISYVNGSAARGASVFSAASGFSGNGWNLEIGGNSSGVPNVINFNSRQGASQVTVSASVTMANGTWYHIALVRSGTLTSIYLNGVSVASGTLSNQTVSSVAALWVGGQDITNYQHWFNGYISNARIVKGTAVYTANFTPPTSPLTAITNTSLLLLAGQQAPFRDSSSNAFTVTANGNAAGSGVEPPSFVPYAGSGYFDGTGDYLSLANNAAFDFGTGDFTIECFFNTQVVSGTAIIFCKHSSATGTWIIYRNASTIQFFCSSTGSSWDICNGVTVGTVSTNTWYHVAVSRSGTSIRSFLNGVIGNTTTSSAALFNGTQVVALGANNIGADFFNGYISNARVVKGTAVYTSNFTPSAAPLTAITNTSLLLLTNNVGPFIDSSANGFPALRNGDTVQSGFNPFSQASAGSGYFDGTGDYLTVPAGSAFAYGTGDFTIELWFYSTAALPAYGANLFAQTVFGTNYLVFKLGSDSPTPTNVISFTATSSGGGTAISSSTTFTQNTWNHCAVCRVSGVVTVYLNGVGGTPTSNTTNLTNTTYVPTIGRYTHEASQHFTGYISNLRVVKGTAVYTSNFTPPTSPLTAISGTSLLLLTDNYSIVNSTSTNLPVTINGNTTISTAQYPTGMSSSIYFDGTGDYLTIPSNAAFQYGTGDFTLEFWLYATAYPTSGTYKNIFDGRGGNYIQTQICVAFYNNGSVTQLLFESGSSRILTATYTPSLNTWNHVAFVRSAGVMTCYINGTSVTSGANTANYTTSYTNYVASYDGTQSFVTGYISNFRIVKGTALYTANFTPPSAPLSTTVTVPNFVTNNIYGMNQIP